MENGLNVLSNFDGISSGLLFLKEAGIKVKNYYASEINKRSILISKKNHPKIKHIGDVTKVSYNDGILHYGENSCISPVIIDLYIGGSPCQGFSRAGVGLNFEDPRSKLIFEHVRIYNELKASNPELKFLLENVNMKKEHENIITGMLGVKPIKINSKLFTAQNRPRTYWTNIEFDQNIIQANYEISDYLDQNVDEKYYIKDELYNSLVLEKNEDHLIIKNATKTGFLKAYPGYNVNVSFPNSKTRRGRVKPKFIGCLTTTNHEGIVTDDLRIRLTTPTECERFQGLPVGYTEHEKVSENQRHFMIGDGWEGKTIKHIFEGLK